MPDPLTRAEVVILKAHIENWRPGRDGEMHPVAQDMARLIETLEVAITALRQPYCPWAHGSCPKCVQAMELLKGWTE